MGGNASRTQDDTERENIVKAVTHPPCAGYEPGRGCWEQEMLNKAQGASIVAIVILALSGAAPAGALGAELQAATADEYQKYAAKVESELAAKAQSGSILWLDSQPDQLAQVKAGEAVAAPWTADGDITVTDGVIHDWVGAVFVPGVSIDQTMELVRDYGNYKAHYGPDVADSKVLSGSGDELKVYLRMAKKLVFTMVLNTEFDVKFTRIGEKQWTSTAVSTKLVEVENPDTPQEKELPEGKGMGFLWKINSYFGFVERDGGVYIEMRSLSLSNPLPSGMWLLQPILVKLPSQSVIATLEATRKALTN